MVPQISHGQLSYLARLAGGGDTPVWVAVTVRGWSIVMLSYCREFPQRGRFRLRFGTVGLVNLGIVGGVGVTYGNNVVTNSRSASRLTVGGPPIFLPIASTLSVLYLRWPPLRHSRLKLPSPVSVVLMSICKQKSVNRCIEMDD